MSTATFGATILNAAPKPPCHTDLVVSMIALTPVWWPTVATALLTVFSGDRTERKSSGIWAESEVEATAVERTPSEAKVSSAARMGEGAEAFRTFLRIRGVDGGAGKVGVCSGAAAGAASLLREIKKERQ